MIGVLTVTYNAAAHLRPFLECCAAQRGVDFELLVIDNASSDGSRALVQGFEALQATLIANRENIGYAGACNQGLRHFMQRGIREVLFINNDTEFGPELFASLLEQRRLHAADAVTPRITYFSRPDHDWYAGGRFVFWKGFQGEHVGEGLPHVAAAVEKPRWTEVAPGCCLLFGMEVFERIGLFDERYFVYFEDTDLLLRMKRSGLHLLYVPGITVAHKVSLSTGGELSPFSIRYYQRNQIYLLRKHFGRGVLALQLPIVVGKVLLRLLLRQDRPAQAVLRLRSIAEGLRMPVHHSPGYS